MRKFYLFSMILILSLTASCAESKELSLQQGKIYLLNFEDKIENITSLPSFNGYKFKLGYASEQTIMYKGKELEQKYIADFVCYDNIVIELKAVDELLPVHKAQVINYLAITGYQLGLLVNFNETKIKPERIVRY